MQMIYRASVAALLAVAGGLSAASATRCGFENGPCCNSPKNNPNIGDCDLDSLACWEGTCMPCGIDGKPACVGAAPHAPPQLEFLPAASSPAALCMVSNLIKCHRLARNSMLCGVCCGTDHGSCNASLPEAVQWIQEPW